MALNKEDMVAAAKAMAAAEKAIRREV